ncbi:MAG TPA: PAS domain S-box protein [Ramlibacter sp.]|jgi:PAS domain S-box-containing protein
MGELAEGGAEFAAAETADEMPELVNRLAQELAQLQRVVADSQRKLATTTRSLEKRSHELMEARAALTLLQSTLDAAQDGMLAMGYFGRAIHFNARFVDIWGIPPHKAATLNDAALLALQLTQVKDPARFLDFVQARRARPEEDRCQMFEMTDGRLLECRVLPQRVRGRRIGSITCFRDVTEHDRLERLVTILETELPERVADARATII